MKLGDLAMDIVCSNFGDVVFVLITEIQKMGTLVS